MIKRKMIYATLLLGMLVNTQTLVAQTPQEVVKSMISIFEKTAVSAKYIISVQEQGSDVPYIYRGNLLMHDEKFALKANGLDVCYDGKTQYVYMSEAQEISISEPTAEELLEVNPILMAKAMYESCEMTFSAMASTGTYEIEFTPKEKDTELEHLAISVRKSDNMLLRLTMISAQDVITELSLSQQTLGVSASAADFVINTSAYPDAFVNDLR